MILDLIFLLSFCAGLSVFVAAVVPIAVRSAVRRGMVDRPDPRKNHGRPTPAIGGVVIVPIFMMALPVLGVGIMTHWPLYLALILVLGMGVIDDHYGLSAGIKLLGQVAVALLLALTGEVLLTHLGTLFGGETPLELKFLSVPFTVVCLVFFMNAMNMMDGLDGLCGGLALVMLAALAIAAGVGSDGVWAAVAVMTGAVLIGFLVHNMRYPGHKRATVFLGDAGSLSLGAIIAWLGVNITMAPTPGIPPILMAFIILVPIADTFALFIARVRAGRGALTPGHDHLHHRLLARGLTAGQVTMAIMGISAILTTTSWALIVAGPEEGILTLLWCTILIVHTARLVWTKCSHLGKEIPHGVNP